MYVFIDIEIFYKYKSYVMHSFFIFSQSIMQVHQSLWLMFNENSPVKVTYQGLQRC